MKLSKKLTISFIFSILISILLISLISNIMINRRFENYLVDEREANFNRIYEDINELYIENNQNFVSMNLLHYNLVENVDLTITNVHGEVIYTNETRMGMGMGMMRQHGMNMNRVDRGEYVEQSYKLKDDDKEVGTLTIGYFDNSYLTDSAMIFKSTLSKSFIISGIFTVTFGFIMSLILSRGLTKPLVIIGNTANEIRSGNLSARSNVDSNTFEIVELSDSINYLGNTLLQQDEIRKRYASDISHELRTPITTLRTHLEAIIDGVWEPTEDHLNILLDETSRLTNLVDDLKDTFRQEEFNQVLNKSKFNISNELNNIVTTFLPMFNKEGYVINTEIEDNVKGTMDLDKFKQIVNNILSNSIRYLSSDGVVKVELNRSNNNMILKIADNGIGIKEKDLNHIFERFYRVDTSRNKTTGGTGLGLSIVKSIVEAHNGNIIIESKYEKGTIVKITIPLE